MNVYCRSLTPSVPVADGALPQYQVDKSFADRRYKVQSARTYFYLNEATCERNMETFLKCLEAVSGNDTCRVFNGFGVALDNWLREFGGSLRKKALLGYFTALLSCLFGVRII